MKPLLITVCCLTCLFVHAADKAVDLASMPVPKRVKVPKLAGQVKVDGALDEPVWKKAAVLTPFLRNDGSGVEREKTMVRIWHDDRALYLGWTCIDADIQATLTARDSKFWEEEVVEFFITPGPLTEYFELQWNPLGGVFDAIIHNHLDRNGVSTNITGDWTFTARNMESAVKLKGTVGNPADRDEMWEVEVSIPFSDLGVEAPKPHAIWRANFYRYNREAGKQPDLVTWSPTLLPSFHQPSRFGYLEFE